MKTLLYKAIFPLLIFSLAAPVPLYSEAVVGKSAPNFELTDQDGDVHSLEKYKGKIVVLEWTNAECPFVRKHYDSKNMQQLQEKYTELGVIWLSINSGAPGKQGHLLPEEISSLLTKEGAKQSAYLRDPEGTVGHLYGASTTPHLFVIDKEGLLQYAGAIDDDSSARVESVAEAKNYVSEALDSLLEGKKVPTPYVAPYGCSVKYG